MQGQGNTQATQQFLTTVLSQRGPSSLSYAEDGKWLIRQHLFSLTSIYPSLLPKTATFTHNDGRSVNLLQADGTIPMVFQAVSYNMPIVIWLMESYPANPPCVYVNPTRDMVIKRSHPHVNASGLVSVPYLQNWIYRSSNLVDLVRELSSIFGHDPPLFSQRRPSNYAGNQSGSSAFGSAGSTDRPGGRGYSLQPVRPYPPPPAPSPAPPPFPPPCVEPARAQVDDPSVAAKRNAINKIVEMAQNDIVRLRKSRESEMEGLFGAQAALRQRQEIIRTGLKELKEEKEALESQLQVMMMNTDIISSWINENHGKTGDFDVDDVFECCDALSRQMLESISSDLAIDDLIYSLDRALQEGALPLDQYLKNVRSLSREQFFHRATAVKVRAAQTQSRVSSMAARVPH